MIGDLVEARRGVLVELGSNCVRHHRLATICQKTEYGLLSRRSVVRAHSGSPSFHLTNQALTGYLPSKQAFSSFQIYDIRRRHTTPSVVESQVEIWGFLGCSEVSDRDLESKPLATSPISSERSFKALDSHSSKHQTQKYRTKIRHGGAS